MFIAVKLNKIIKILLTIFLLIGFLIIGVKLVSKVYPLKYMDIVQEMSIKYSLDQAFVCGVICTESRFDANALSNKGASGLMQLTESTADWGAEEISLSSYSYERIFEPEINIELGCWYLRRLVNQYDGDYKLVLAAYNGGSGNVAKWLSDSAYSTDGKTLTDIPFKETKNYVDRVNKNTKIYSYLLSIYKFGGIM